MHRRFAVTTARRRAFLPLVFGLAYTAAFLLPTLTSVSFIASRLRTIGVTATPAFPTPALEQPAYDPMKPTAVFLMGNTGTEITDLLAPYEVFAATHAFNLYTLAPERTLSPVVTSFQADSGLDILPHLSFTEFAELHPAQPDVIVIPYIRKFRESADHAIVDWIRQNTGPETLLVSICGGAALLADTGFLDGHPATSHWSVMAPVMQLYPNVQWRRGERYIETGNIITSAGITSGVDASLAAIRRVLGADVARSVGERLNYPLTRYLDDSRYRIDALTASDQLAVIANAAFPWERSTLGAYLFEGVSEIALSAVVDTYHQSQLTTPSTVGRTREIIRSRHGLLLAPRYTLVDAPRYDRVIVPGDQLPAAEAGLDSWARDRGIPLETLATIAGAPGGYPFDVTLADFARRQSRTSTQLGARVLEYPLDHLNLANTGWQRIPIRVLTLLVSGALLAIGLNRGLTRWGEQRRPQLQPLAA